MFGGHRVEPRCGMRAGLDGQRGVGGVLYVQAGCRIGLHWQSRLRQRPMGGGALPCIELFETDRIEAGKRRTALIVRWSGRIGLRMERCQIPLRDLGCRCTGGGKDQRCIRLVTQR